MLSSLMAHQKLMKSSEMDLKTMGTVCNAFSHYTLNVAAGNFVRTIHICVAAVMVNVMLHLEDTKRDERDKTAGASAAEMSRMQMQA